MGIVFSIEEFSVFDGPGIRTAVLLKGCPLNCSWCHNPEGRDPRPEVIKSPNGCVHCGACSKFTVTEGERTFLLPDSIKKCPMNLIRKCGEFMTAEELCKKLLKNERILSDGGITFSGGEPLYQHEFLFACLEILKGRMHTAIQTTGFCSKDVFKKAVALADYFLYDLKIVNEEKHKRYTGVSNKQILENFSFLAASGIPFTARTPLIPGVTDTIENIESIAAFLKQNGVGYIELLPYNKLAGAKYKAAGRVFAPDFDPSVSPQPHVEVFRSSNIKVKIL